MKISTYLAIIFLFTMSFVMVGVSGAAKVIEVEKDEPAAVEEATSDELQFDDIKLPEKDSPEYWVVRSEAIGELTPLLTKKRAEMKKKRQLLADYLLKIGKAEDMAAANVVVPNDPALYAKALGVDEGIKDLDAKMPKKLPSWEELAQFSMRFVLHEGYRPMLFDNAEDAAGFAEVCRKKEEYAQKVRKEMRGYVKDCLKMWTYLGTIGEQSAAKEWAVGMKLDAEKMKNAERAKVAEDRRMAAMERQDEEKERKFQDAQDRASFSSSTKERRFESRNDRLQYQQTLLNERYTNHYRW
jgi:anti-sigma-K factor RskA